VACETFAKSNVVVVGGEITIPKIQNKKLGTTKPIGEVINVGKIIRDAVRGIGYTNDDDVFHADQIFINNYLTTQSPDIAQGVDAAEAEGKKHAEQGAGDQGIMFGYACDETPELMPAPIMFAHRLGRELTRIRKAGKLGQVAPPRRKEPGLRGIRGWKANPHRQRRHLHPARCRREPRRDREVLHRAGHQESPAEGTC
jgi:S-adenosylmethionine synthetase